jgi:hypothetical protein
LPAPAPEWRACAGYPDGFDALGGKFDYDTRARIAFAQSCCRCCPALACRRCVVALRWLWHQLKRFVFDE